jgi:hypothetical protein
MTRKDYELIASVFKATGIRDMEDWNEPIPSPCWYNMLNAFCSVMARENPRFNKDTFTKAATPTNPKQGGAWFSPSGSATFASKE